MVQTPGTLTIILSVLALIVSASSFLIPYTTGRQRDRITQTFAFLNEWRSAEYTTARDSIFKTIEPKLKDPDLVSKGLDGLEPEEKQLVRRVAHLLEYAGTAMALGFIDERLVIIEIGDPVERLWRILGKLVYAERAIREEKDRNSPFASPTRYKAVYQAGFEHLAERVRIFPKARRLQFSAYRWDATESSPRELSQ